MGITAVLHVTLLAATMGAGDGPLLSGAFVQFDANNSLWDKDKWEKMLDSMHGAGLDKIIVQYMELSVDGENPREESYAQRTRNDRDPLGTILSYAEGKGMQVFVGLRLDKRLENPDVLNSPDPEELRKAIAEELPRNKDLVKKLATRYQLKTRPSFAGWYLPVGVANVKETAGKPADGWVPQLSNFTKAIVSAAKCEVRDNTGKVPDKKVAVSPYFNPRLNDDLVTAKQMGEQYKRFLKDTGIDIVMPRDAVGKQRIPASDIKKCVEPFLISLKEACDANKIEYWVNVESICADVERLKQQLQVGAGVGTKTIVTFEFPHNMYQTPLYDDYLKLITKPGGGS
jgi:Domain of unknown function (DUF4434)